MGSGSLPIVADAHPEPDDGMAPVAIGYGPINPMLMPEGSVK